MIAHMMGKYGWLTEAPEGAITVNFERLYPQDIEALWHLITDPRALDRWSPSFKFQAQLGGKYELWFEESPSGPPHIQGNIEAFQPPNLLQLGRHYISTKSSRYRLPTGVPRHLGVQTNYEQIRRGVSRTRRLASLFRPSGTSAQPKQGATRTPQNPTTQTLHSKVVTW